MDNRKGKEPAKSPDRSNNSKKKKQRMSEEEQQRIEAVNKRFNIETDQFQKMRKNVEQAAGNKEAAQGLSAALATSLTNIFNEDFWNENIWNEIKKKFEADSSSTVTVPRSKRSKSSSISSHSTFRHRCRFCSKQNFSNANALAGHIRSFCKKKGGSSSSSSPSSKQSLCRSSSSSSLISNNSSGFRCDNCGRTLSSPEALSGHKGQCNKKPTDKSLDSDMDESRKSPPPGGEGSSRKE